MNNEELATNLRQEIETYLKSTVADLRQEIAELQERIGAEIESYRAKIEQLFSESMSIDNVVAIDDDFVRLVAEHLQIAREDGAKEAAAAVETQVAEKPANLPDFSLMRDAINEISAQTSQADILKTLVKYASEFASRGAFFIVKSEHLVGWRLLGSEMSDDNDESVREVIFPLSSETLLSNSIKQNVTMRGSRSQSYENAQYLQKLNFSEPSQMVAIPLVVRGRGVAVLYADSGANDTPIQVEALESLARVASQTVELQAAAKSPAVAPRQTVQAVAPATTVEQANKSDIKDSSFKAFAPSTEKPNVEPLKEPAEATIKPASEPMPVNNNKYGVSLEKTEPQSFEQNFSGATEQKPFEEKSFEAQPAADFSFNAPEATPAFEVQTNSNFSSFESFSAPQQSETTFSFEPSRTEQPVDNRNAELPVNVPEAEKDLHNKARRFARLLVSEIKLYNEQKVQEGRQHGDLYSRLREAIDRSRETYNNRIEPSVANRFDYFHYELVKTLGEGDVSKLGQGYPGTSV